MKMMKMILMRASNIDRRIILGALLALLVAFPLVIRNPYFIDVATLAGLYVILGLGLNIVVGFAGLLDLGYVAFYAIGAYSTAILSTELQWSFWFLMPLGGVLAGMLGILLGFPVLRMRPHYLALVTMGFGEIIRISLNNLDQLTGGPNGIVGIPRPNLFGLVLREPIHFYYLVLLVAVFTIVVVSRLGDSRIGRAWTYIREDEVAAEAMGINAVTTKLLAFGMGATWAGFAGAIFATKLTTVAPESFILWESVLILVIVLLGGMGSIPGVIVGVGAMIVLPEIFREFADYRFIVFGAALVAMMIFRPEGIWPSAVRRRELHEKDAPNVAEAGMVEQEPITVERAREIGS